VSERDETATDAEAPKPKKRKKKKKRRPDKVERAIGVGLDPAGAVGHVAEVVAEVTPKTRFFAPQRFVIAGGFAIATGLALVGTEPSDLGRALWIGGLLLLVTGIHMLGRLGPDLGAG
jgi:hypothetical protein